MQNEAFKKKTLDPQKNTSNVFITTTTTKKKKKHPCPEGCLNPIASSLFSPSWSVDPVSCSIWPPPKSWWHLSWPKTSASSRALTPVHVPRAPPSPLEKHPQLLRRSVLGGVVLDANPRYTKLPFFLKPQRFECFKPSKPTSWKAENSWDSLCRISIFHISQGPEQTMFHFWSTHTNKLLPPHLPRHLRGKKVLIQILGQIMSNAIGRLYEELHFCQKNCQELCFCWFADLLFAPLLYHLLALVTHVDIKLHIAIYIHYVYMHPYIQVWTSLYLTLKCHLDDLSYHPKNSTLKKTAIVFCHFNEQTCVTVCDQ